MNDLIIGDFSLVQIHSHSSELRGMQEIRAQIY